MYYVDDPGLTCAPKREKHMTTHTQKHLKMYYRMKKLKVIHELISRLDN